MSLLAGKKAPTLSHAVRHSHDATVDGSAPAASSEYGHCLDLNDLGSDGPKGKTASFLQIRDGDRRVDLSYDQLRAMMS